MLNNKNSIYKIGFRYFEFEKFNIYYNTITFIFLNKKGIILIIFKRKNSVHNLHIDYLKNKQNI